MSGAIPRQERKHVAHSSRTKKSTQENNVNPKNVNPALSPPELNLNSSLTSSLSKEDRNEYSQEVIKSINIAHSTGKLIILS